MDDIVCLAPSLRLRQNIREMKGVVKKEKHSPINQVNALEAFA